MLSDEHQSMDKKLVTEIETRGKREKLLVEFRIVRLGYHAIVLFGHN